MTESEEHREPLEVLAEEFMERQRSGESPTIAEYAAKYPELAAEIEELFPAIAVVERLKTHKEHESGSRVSLGGVRMDRLGDFLIIGEIGRGGMGIVYEAFQESLGRHVAVKVLPRQSLLDSTRLQRFHREAQTAAKLHHTNIVPIFGVGEHEGYHYIVMQLIRGVGLDAVIAELRQMDSFAAMAREGRQGSAVHTEYARNSEAARLAAALAEGRVWEAHDLDSFSDNSGDLKNSFSKNGAAGAEASLFSTSAVTQDFSRAFSKEAEPPRQCVPRQSLGTSTESTPPPFSMHRFGASYWRGVATIGMQVADALHYAHGHHTLHRDIKPANLLLDAKGVVWITDFGLAKAMEQDNVTQDGDMVGTLRYMAPEQFSGHADARSDIYNLGVTLYELLVARPAFEGSDRNSLMHKITHDHPPHPRKINPAIPRDLETIVFKAIAREPRDRYQSAGDMASDLQCFLEDRPIKARRASMPERLWRWSRRNRAVAGLAASSLLLLIAIAVLASVGYLRTTQANIEEKKQRKKAEETSKLAVEALDNIFRQFAPDRAAPASSMLIVSDTGEKISVPVQPVLSKETASLLERMLGFYERLAKQGGDDVHLREKVAEANRRVGDIRQRLGQNEESKTAYLRAAAMYEQLAESAGDKTPLLAEIARIRNELGAVQCAMNQPESGYASYLSALKMLKEIAGDKSALPASRYELARTYFFLGKRPGDQHGPPPFMLGGPPGPPPEEQRDPLDFGFDFMDPPFGPPGPDDGDGPPPFDFFLGPPPGRPHEPPEGEGDSPDPPHGFPPSFPDADHDYLQKAVDLLQQLIADHPEVPDYRHLLARCYREISQQWFGRSEIAAPDAANKAIELLRTLVDKYPDVPDYRYDLGETYLALESTKMFSIKPADKDALRQSRETIEKALAISEELVAEHPNIPDYALSMMHIRLRLAFMLSESDPPSAEKYFRKAIEAQSTLIRHFPQVSIYKFGLTFILDSLARFYQQQGRLPEAQSMLRESIALIKENLQNHPEAHPLRGILARNYAVLADLLRTTGDEQAAAETDEQAKLLRTGR